MHPLRQGHPLQFTTLNLTLVDRYSSDHCSCFSVSVLCIIGAKLLGYPVCLLVAFRLPQAKIS